jgi:hypothetical protein
MVNYIYLNGWFKMNLDSIYKGVAYIRSSYSLISIPMQFISYMIIIYEFGLEKIPFIKNIFPTFNSFFNLCLVLAFFLAILGYFYKMKSTLYKKEIEVNVLANPYMIEKLVPNVIPIYKIYIEFFKKHGIDTSEIERLVANSE